MLTLNQVVKNLNYISNAHTQLNTFFFGELYDFASSGTTNYPAMAVTLNPSQYNMNNLTYSFDIYVLDLVHKDISNATEVLSDTVQICVDIIGVLDNPVYDWKLDKVSTLEDIQGGHDDEVYGHKFNVKLKTPYPTDRCASPFGTITVVSPISSTTNRLLDEDGNIIQTNDGFYIIPD